MITLCEIAVILAQEYPSPYSKSILAALSSRSGASSHVRITDTFLLGWVLLMAGSLTRLACYRTLGRHFTFHMIALKRQRSIRETYWLIPNIYSYVV